MLKKVLILLLSCIICISCFTSCTSHKVALQYKDKSLDEADYAYLLSFIKGYYEAYYNSMASYYGSTISLADLMDKEMADGSTFADQLTTAVNETAMMMVVAERLCDEFGLELKDDETISSINQALQDLEDDYGGEDALNIELAKLGLKRSSIERYERYNELLALLKDYRFGENGVDKISDEDIKKEYLNSYVKAEGYCYSYLDTDSSGNTVMYQYDFAGDYSDSAVKEYFLSNYIKVSYLAFDDQDDAQNALNEIQNGKNPEEFYSECAAHTEGKCISSKNASDTIYSGLVAAEEGKWILEDADEGWYILSKQSVSEEDLKNAEEDVRQNILENEAHDFYNNQYITVQHILYDESDGDTAKSVYDELVAGTTTMDAHKDETKDSGYKYSFTFGTMDSKFEEASMGTDIGKYALVQSSFGWHVIYRMELDETDFNLNDVVAAMTRAFLKEQSKEMFDKMKKDGSSFVKPDDTSVYTYSEPTVLKFSSLNSQLGEALKNAKDNELIYLNLDANGIYILRKIESTSEDINSVYDDVSSPLVSEAFYQYLSSYFDQVTVNQEVLNQFDIRTAETFYF